MLVLPTLSVFGLLLRKEGLEEKGLWGAPSLPLLLCHHFQSQGETAATRTDLVLTLSLTEPPHVTGPLTASAHKTA